LVIVIPVGGFVPEFTARAEPEPTATQPARSPDAPKVGAKRAWALKASAAAALRDCGKPLLTVDDPANDTLLGFAARIQVGAGK